ncbi:MAG: phospholipase D-like domain-containing protein [Carbonactinosporaceae bacterium]
MQLVFAAPAMADADRITPNPGDPPPFGCVDQTPDPSTNAITICTNDNKGQTASDAVIVDELTRLVNRANGPEDTLRISMFQWWYKKENTTPPFDHSHLKALTDAIINAHRNGVDVKILIDNISDPGFNQDLDQVRNPDGTFLDQPFKELTTALGSDVQVCHQDGNKLKNTMGGPYASDCLDGGGEYVPKAINHNKFFLLKLDGIKHVVVTSANMVPDVQRAYNNLIHVRWDARLYDYMLGYWDRISANDWIGWGSPRSSCGDSCRRLAFLFPNHLYWDHFLEVLNDVTACPDSGNRKIWISMSGVTEVRLQTNNDALLNRIDTLNFMGCGVKFLVDDHATDVGDDDTETTAVGLLISRGADVVQVASLHHKFLIVDAEVNGVLHENYWTGAMNLSFASAWRDGESAVHQEDDGTFQAYRSHFTCVWNRNRIGAPNIVGSNNDEPC